MDTTTTEAPAFANSCSFKHIRLTTRQATEFIDLTDELNEFLTAVGLQTGILNLQTSHTTTAVVVSEHEPLLLADFLELIERIAPRQRAYGHDDMSRRAGVGAGEPRNGHAHCRALLLPSAACLNVVEGRLALGRWQRVFLVELDGPRPRTISVIAVGE